MTSLVLMRTVSPRDRTGWDTLLAALNRAGATVEDASGRTVWQRGGGGECRVALVGGLIDIHKALASIDDPSIRVFAEVDRGSTTSRKRSGWLRDALRAVGSPGGTPLGRARPESLRHSAR